MPKAPIPQHVTELIHTYQSAQINLINYIATNPQETTVTAFKKRVLKSINEELRVLNEFASGWAEDNIPIAYKTGATSTYEKFRELNIEVGKVQINTRVVKNLVDNAKGMLIDANNYVGRMINDEIRKVSLEVIAEKVATGSTVKEAQKKLVQRLTDNGVAHIVDKRGRSIRLESYAETVARTTTAEATNKGAINAVTDLGEDLVRMTWHNASCPICAPLEGRIYSISGDSKSYPPLSEALPDGRNTPHPNCRHRFVPYFTKYDDDAEKNKTFSNRPFEIGKQEQAKVDAYYKAQREKAALNKAKKDWQAARLVAPTETPKTLNGYVKLKANKPEEFKTLRSKVLDVKRSETLKRTLPVGKEKWSFKAANSTVEVKERISTALGTKAVNLDKVPIELGNQYLEGIETFANDYPEIRGFLEKVDTEVPARTYGVCKITGSPIDNNQNYKISTALSLKSPKNVDKMLSDYAEEIARGFQYIGDSPKMTAIHECTHALDSLLSAKVNGAFSNGKLNIVSRTKALNEYVGGYSYQIIDKAYIDVFGRKQGKDVYEGIKHLGTYAMTNSKEMLAQCVAYEYSGKTAKFSAKVKELFDAKVKEVFGR